MATFNNNFKVKNGLDAVGVVTSAGLSLLSTTSPITLNGSTGTSGQILTSAGTGGTPTWASSFSGFLSTTNTGKTGSVSFITPGSSSQATWANYPVGLGTMVNTNQGSNGAPNNNYHYFFKVANRDFGGGWGGISIDYNTGDFYAGRADTSSVYATWHRLANTSLANTFAGVQTFSDTITHNGFYQNFNNMLTSGRMTIGLSTLSSGVQLGVYSTSATNVGTIIRAAVSQSANLLEIQNSASSILSRFSSSGQFVSDQQTYIGSGATSISNARFNLATGSASVVGQVVRGAANQLEDTIEIQNSAGTVLGGFSANAQTYSGSTAPLNSSTGGATTTASGTGTVATITTTSAHGLAVGDRVTVAGITPTGYNGTFIVTATPSTTQLSYSNTTTGSQTVAGTVRVDAQASITSRSAATIGLLVRAAASQASNPFEVQNSSGSVIANITSAGGVRATGTLQGSTLSAVADGSTIAVMSAGKNVQFGGGSTSIGGGSGVIGITNATTVPSSSPSGGGILYVDSGALKYRGTSGSAATIVNADGTSSGGGTFTGGTLTSGLVLATGTTSLEPLKFVAGTNLTTPVTGVKEYDGTVFYSTANTNPGRALETQSYYYVSSSNYIVDFSGSGAAQSILGGTTTGITVAAGTTYEFELDAAIQHQYQVNTGITGTFSMANSGGATVAGTWFVDYGSNTTSFTTATTMSSVRTTGNVTFSAAISSGSRYNIIKVRGIIRITGSGTTKIYPALAASATNDNTWTVQSGAVFKMTPIGNGTITTVGTWA